MDECGQQGTVQAMLDFTQAVIALGCAAAGAASGVPLAFAAARRSQAQPVPGSVADERAVLGYLIDEPRTIVEMNHFTAESFTLPAHQQAWRMLCEESGGLPDAERGHVGDTDSATLDNDDFPVLTARLAEFAQQEAGKACVAAAAGTLEDARQAGERVLTLEVDRATFIGGTPVHSSGEGLVRPLVRPSRARLVFSCLWMGLVGAISAVSAFYSGGALAGILAGLSLLLLGAASLVWALVDVDTLFLDMPSFFIGAGASWVPVTVACAWTGSWGNLLLAAGCALGVVVIFVVSDAVYRKVRGRAGMGGGDSLIALATIGVPVAVTGQGIVAYQSLMAALGLAIVWSLVVAVTRRDASRAQRPFAFGPFLAGGWLLAMSWWVVSA